MYQFNETLVVPSKDIDDQISSPKLTVSPTLSSSKVKRGFKSNTSAAFLRKRIYSGKEGPEDNNDNLSTQTSLSSLDDKSSKPSSPGESLELKEGGNAHFIDNSDSTTTTDEEAFEGSEDQAILPQKFYRVMVIGPRDVGKRSFVNGLFSSNGGSVKSQKQPFDLIVKTMADGISNKRYNFWLKESEGLRKNYNSIYNVYYETCSVIFLVYNSEEENAMNFIDKELESLQGNNSRKNKKIVVLDTNNSPRNSEHPQLEELKSKYGFRMSLELNRMPHSDKGILDIIDNMCETSE